MMPMRRPRFARCLLPFFLLLCALFCAGCAEEQFTPTTDLDNFQKLQQQKEQAEVKPEVQAVTPAAMTASQICPSASSPSPVIMTGLPSAIHWQKRNMTMSGLPAGP